VLTQRHQKEQTQRPQRQVTFETWLSFQFVIHADDVSFAPYVLSFVVGSSNTAQAQRLPLGWLSSMVGSSATDEGTAISASRNSAWGSAPSYFDDIEADLDDPILKQVEFNRLNPHAAAQQRASGGGINKVLDMWNSFMATEPETPVAHSSGGADSDAATPIGGNGSSAGGGSAAATATAAREPYVPGVGPVWVVTLLTWYRHICGITLTVTSTEGAVLYRASTGSNTAPPALGTVRRRVQENVRRVTLAVFSVTVPLPAEKTALSIAILILHILKVVLLTVVSVLLRIVVVVCTLLYICISSIVSSISGSSAVQNVVNSARLRRFFANDSVNSLLGGDARAPGELVRMLF
jgi:hypothetical protein